MSPTRNSTPPAASATSPRNRSGRREATRRVILDAAIDCFSRLGFDGTHFREITSLSGAQRSLILYHFQTKEELWRQAVLEIERRFNADFEARYQPGTQPDDRERIRHAMACFVDSLCAIPEYARILLREGSSSGPRMEWLARHFVPRRALSLNLDDQAIERRIRTTVLRDILASALVAFIALGPLMERSLAQVTRQASVGVHPLSEQRKREFVDYMVQLVVDSRDPA